MLEKVYPHPEHRSILVTIVCHGELHQFIPIFALGYGLGFKLFKFKFGFSLFSLGWMIGVRFFIVNIGFVFFPHTFE